MSSSWKRSLCVGVGVAAWGLCAEAAEPEAAGASGKATRVVERPSFKQLDAELDAESAPPGGRTNTTATVKAPSGDASGANAGTTNAPPAGTLAPAFAPGAEQETLTQAPALLKPDQLRLRLKAGIEGIAGNTTYDIKLAEVIPHGDPDFPAGGRVEVESKLEFDIRAMMANVGAELPLMQDRLTISLRGGVALVTPDGNLRDRDWIRNNAINQVAGPLIGDTDTDIQSKGWTWDARVIWQAVPEDALHNLSLSLDAGWQHQHWGPIHGNNISGFYVDLTGARSDVNETFPGDAIDYEVDYNLVFIGGGIDWRVEPAWKIGANLDLGVAAAQDRDDHILRRKLSKGDTTGWSEDLRLQSEWRITEAVEARVFANVLAIQTDGDQNQYEYDAFGQISSSIGTIPDKITSIQMSGGAEVIYGF